MPKLERADVVSLPDDNDQVSVKGGQKKILETVGEGMNRSTLLSGDSVAQE